MSKIIGTNTAYHGTEHPYLTAHVVRVIAVLKNAAKPGIDVDGPEWRRLTDDGEIAGAGGISANDRVEVQPWIAQEGRFSFASSDPKASDLSCFAHLR